MRLATWGEVRDYVVLTHPRSEERAPGLVVTVALPEGAPTIELAPHEIDGRPWVAITGTIASVRNVIPTWSLGANAASPVGILAIAGSRVIARHLLPLETTRQNVDDVVKAIAYQCLLGKGALGE